jgi:lipopolysaccharide heptosyltransferase II
LKNKIANWKLQIENPVKILLIRLRLIGDVVFTTPAIRAIRRRYPDARLTYIVQAAALPVVQGNPHINEVIVAADERGWTTLREDWALAKRLRNERFDIAIDFHGGPRSSFLAWASRARVRVGYHVTGRSWMYTTRVPRPRALRPRHSVENQWDLLTPLGIEPPDRWRDPTEMPLNLEAVRALEERFTAAGLRSEDRLIVMHVSAGNAFRRWPQAAFIDLARRLVEGDPRRRVLVTSGPSDLAAARAIANAVREHLTEERRQAILECPELSLAELRACLPRASLFIGGDSGPLHIASTTAVPIVGIFGPTLPARSAPWRHPDAITESVDVGELPCRPCDQRSCAPGDYRCLTRLSASAVLAAAERALADAQSRQRPRATASVH